MTTMTAAKMTCELIRTSGSRYLKIDKSTQTHVFEMIIGGAKKTRVGDQVNPPVVQGGAIKRLQYRRWTRIDNNPASVVRRARTPTPSLLLPGHKANNNAPETEG